MRVLLHILLCQIVANVARANTSETFVVDTTLGPIRGRVYEVEGATYGLFRGIPYAEPPTDELRFQAPVPRSPWGPAELDASNEFHTVCMQQPQPGAQSPATYEQSEDCLFLKVITPITTSSDETKYPVMFWIHGGGAYGSGDDYDMEGTMSNLVKHGVVAVIINYRLGPLGFFTTKTHAAPGNSGSLDQIMALEWVQENIDVFGGDPTKVTVFGESYGASGTSFLTQSPLAQGLFSQAIIMSGSSLATWALMYDGPDDLPAKLKKDVGCSEFGHYYAYDQMVLDCLRSRSAEEVTLGGQETAESYWSARIDGIFLPDTIENLTKNRVRMPVIIGTTKDEEALTRAPLSKCVQSMELGSILALGHYKPKSGESIIKMADDLITEKVGFTNIPAIKAAVKYNFIDSVKPPSEAADPTLWIDEVVKFHAGFNFFAPGIKEALAFKEIGSPVYLYSFDHISEEAMLYSPWIGAHHAAELMYLFGPKALAGSWLSGPITNQTDKEVRTIMGRLWTNFAKYGNPTPKPVAGVSWEAMDVNRTNYLSIKNPGLAMHNDYNWKEVAFWNDLVPALQESDTFCERAKDQADKPLFLYLYTMVYC